MHPTPESVFANRRPGAAAGWGFLALMTLSLLWLVGTREQLPWTHTTTAVTVAGEHYRVDESTLTWLRDFSAGHFATAYDGTRDELVAELDLHLEQMFTAAGSRIPAFADWYYSLAGEYSRLTMATLAFANFAEPGYVATRAAETLLPEELWTRELADLQLRVSETLAARHRGLRNSWLETLTERLAPYRVPPPVNDSTAHRDNDAVALDQLLAALTQREQEALQMRAGVSTLAAGGVAAGPALWRAAGARNPAAAGRAAARSAGRGAARAGSAATSGVTLCAPAGFAAVGCGILAGAAAWLATDWVLLRVDEHMNREELEQALHEGLDLLQAELREELIAGYDRMLAGWFSELNADIGTGFVPARAGHGAAGNRTP